MSNSVVSAIDRPDLLEVAVRWRWNEWSRERQPFGSALARAQNAAALRLDIPQTFILLVDDAPVGTAALTAHDLDERPDLTPWLASVFVAPEARGRGHAAKLVAAVEAEARRQSVATLWLHTNTAERVYARLGWLPVETVPRMGKQPVLLMRRDFP